MNQRSKIILISVLSVILGVVCLLTGRSLYKPVVPAQGAGETPVPTVVAYDPTKAEGTAENPFTILEIVPNYTHAQIGYLIDGQEPVKVYGTGGILENAQAGYAGAYEYLEKLSEFTVYGQKGGMSGAGDGTGGGSRTIYAFDDEKSKFETAGDVPAGATWEQSEEKINRVKGYYTVASSDDVANSELIKYELVQKSTYNQYDPSGIDGKVYGSGWNGFREAYWWEDGEYNRYQITTNGNHRFADGQSGENLQKYDASTSGYRSYYYRDDTGRFIYSGGYMYYEQSDGDYVKNYSNSYYIYQMEDVGTNPTDTSKTYYIYVGPLSYEDNNAYLNGAYTIDYTIWIEGTAYNGYFITNEEYYYTYTIEEEVVSPYVFEDEKTAGVEYDEKGTTERAGSYYAADTQIRNNAEIQKYEYVRMLKTEAAGYGWTALGWGGLGLDEKEYSFDKIIGFKLATQEEKDDDKILKYDKPFGFVIALDYDDDDEKDNGSDNSRYKQLAESENNKIVGTPQNWYTYNLSPVSWGFVEKPGDWTAADGLTYDYDVTYVSAASYNNKKYSIKNGISTDELWFVTFAKGDSGKKYSPSGGYNNNNDTNNKYFYWRSGNGKDQTYSLIGNSYSGYDRNGFRYLVTFSSNNKGEYYVTSAVKYLQQNGKPITNESIDKIASMLYTKEVDTNHYVEAEGTTGQFVWKEKPRNYEYDATGKGDYIYYNGRLYTKDSAGNFVLYKAVTGQGDGENYYYFGSEFYRKNPDGDYVATYDFQEKAGGEYIYWLRPVDQDYVDANAETTFYYWKGLSYTDNLKYFNSATFKNEVKAAANWKLVETRTESYFAKKPDPVDPGTPTPPVVIPTDTVTIAHSNVFLKNVMNFAYQDNDPKKPLDIDRFEFAGWYTEPECINKYDFENSVLTSNITLYAKWIPKTDGDLVYVDATKYPKAYTVKFYAKADATEPGYTLEHYNADLDLSKDKVTYVPVYEKAVDDKKDYLFQGWSTKKNGIEEDILTTVSYTDTTVNLYPVWKVLEATDDKVMDVTGATPVAVTETHTVEFYVTKDGATSVVKTLEVYENGYIKPEEGVALTDKYLKALAAFKPEAQTDKVFAGWYTEETPEFATHVPYTFGTPVTEDVKLYACWVEKALLANEATMPKLTITFDGNQESVKTLLLNAEKQVVEEVCTDIAYPAFKTDGTPIEVKPLTVNKTPQLMGNVQFKATNYKVEVKTMLPADLNALTADELDELLNKADMIVVGNSNQHSDYSDIFNKYAVKRGGTNGYTGSNDLKFSVATAIFKKSMEAGSAPVLLDKTLLSYRSSDSTAKYNVYKLFVMLQSMDSAMFYDYYLKSNATNVAPSQLWERIESDGSYNGHDRWFCDWFVDGLGLDDAEKIHYGIDKDATYTASAYPTSLTNHCYVYSGEVFKNGTEFTKNVITEDEFYTANLFDYLNGKKEAVDSKYAPADAVNYMAFGYQPEPGLNETTSFLEIQPTQSFENLKFWLLYVKKFLPNYNGKLVIERGNKDDVCFYLGTADASNCRNTLTIEQMASTEFVGKICDLSGDYRMIYLGVRQINLIDGEKNTIYKERFEDTIPKNTDGNYYAYFHTGNVRTLTHDDFQGQLSTDGYSDYIDKFCYPGNDFTKIKCDALLAFCKTAELPVVLGSGFFAGDEINEKLIDNSTYLYQTLVYGRTEATEAEATGLKDLDSCFKYGDTSKEAELKTLLNQPNLRIVYEDSSDIPPEYKVTYAADGKTVTEITGYLNPNHETERVLSFSFYLQGDTTAEYDVRLFIDMNADGKHTEATEKLDSLVVYDNTTGRYLSKYDYMTAGHNYTVKRSINDYVGILPWKLEVYDRAKPELHDAITGMTAIKTTKLADGETRVYEKEKLKILQICSGPGSGMGNTTVYMPSIKDIENALHGTEGYTKDGIKKAYVNFEYDEFTTDQKSAIRTKMNGLGVSGVTYMFWEYLANLEDFDVEITRIGDVYNGYGGVARLQDLYNAIADDPLYLEQFNMIILGFADCFNDIEEEKTLRAIEDFIASGKSILFTHDTTSFNNLAVEGRDPRGEWRDHQDTIWGYHINRYFRNIVGMDRYGATLIYDEDREDHSEELANKDKVYKANGEQETYVTATDSVLDEEKALVHGYSRWEVWKGKGSYSNETTTYASKTNDGQLTKYPYEVGDDIRVATTHSQYYQLDLEADDIVVWYCLSDNSSQTNKYYNEYYNDAANNYYIYNKGNITYSGVGHDGNLTNDEAKLFVNTMVAAYAASADPTAPQIINFDRTTGTDKIDYVYVDYDTIHPELAIGEGVDGDKDAEGKALPSNQTKEVNFKLTENSIVTNKLMTMYVYELKTAGTPNVYETLPMEMEVRRYTSETTTEVVNAIPVFIVTKGGTYGTKGEYVYTPGQIIAIDDNTIHNDGSGSYIKIGGEQSKDTFTATVKAGTNGYYITSATVAICPQSGVKDDGTPEYDTSASVEGRIFMAPVVEAGEEYMFKAPIDDLIDKDMVPYMLHVNLRYGKRQDKSQNGYKELSVVRRGLFNLD